MSAETSGNISHVQDEDVLRKMWQETEDFGKKKEIRSHMYKLREERLRYFYSDSSSNQKEGNGPNHADSLADHSFLSLKSKEIRDSESPTREMHFRVDKSRGPDQGWNVMTKNESSPDGKTHTSSRVATTSGSDKIAGGVANYAAVCEQQASVHNDGDDQNYTKSSATSSKNVIKQEAKGGDDNSNFQSYSTSSSSSSKVVSQQRSTSGDVDDSSSNVVRRVYTTDVPAELKKHPNYIDANTKVTTETRTLPDGSRVTTTRYETRGADHHATSEKKSSSTVSSSSSKIESSSNRSVHDSRRSVQDSRDVQDSRSTHDDFYNSQIVRQVPVNYDHTDRSVEVIRSSNDDVNQSVNKTSSVNIQKSHHHKVVDSRNVDVNVVQSKTNVSSDVTHRDHQDDVRTIRLIQENEYLPREPETIVREEVIRTKDGTVKKITTQDVRGANTHIVKKTVQEQSAPRETHHEDVRTIRVIQDNEFVPREPETIVREEVIRTKDGTVKKITTQDVRGANTHIVKKTVQEQSSPRETHHEDVRTIRVIQENEYSPREPETTVREEVIRTKDGTVKKITTQDVRGANTHIVKKTVQEQSAPRETHHEDIRTIRVIKENEYSPREPEEVMRTKDVRGANTHIVKKTVQEPSEIITTRREVTTTNKSEHIPLSNQDDVHLMRIIQENEYLPRGQETPSTPGDRTPISHTPAPEQVCHLLPQKKPESITTKTTRTTVTTNVDQTGHTDDFINKEREQTEPTPKQPRPVQKEPKYDTPEKRVPIKPGRSELDEKPTPTDGQYQTTYRTDYVNKRISVDVSPTHDAFARSLRAISPDRDKKRGSTRSLKSSTSSLRSSTSPEKHHPESPRRRSPTKQTPNGTANTDTITRRRKDEPHTPVRKSPERKPSYDSVTRTTKEVDSSTLTRRPKTHPRSRSTSPTSIASDIEFVKSSEIITDLDDEINTRRDVIKTQRNEVTEKRPFSLNVTTTTTTKKTRKITDRSPTSPITEKDRPLKRRDTYEDRCRQILGIPDKKTPIDGSPRSSSKSPEKSRSPTKETPRTKVQEFPSQIRRSPEKSPLQKPSEKCRPTKDKPKVQEFPSQIRRSPEKQPLEKPGDKPRPNTYVTKIQEFPAQIRRSPEKQPLEKPCEKTRPYKEGPKVQEFPSQIRRSPEKHPLEKPCEKTRPYKEGPKVQEFPSQIRRSPEKHPLEKPCEKTRPIKEAPKVQEFPSQTRRSPEKQPRGEPPSQFKKVPGLGRAPGQTDEPLFTKKFISTLCRDEEVERRKTEEYITPSDTDSDQPHKTVKKDSPDKKYPTTKLIDSERTDTDITINTTREDYKPYKPDRTSPTRIPLSRDRVSPDRKTMTETEIREYTTKITDRKSPTRIPSSRDRVSPDRKTMTETETREYTTNISDRKSPTRIPLSRDRVSPDRKTRTETEIHEYTSITDRTSPTRDDKRRPSPDRIRGVTEYTDEYCTTDKRNTTKTDRTTKIDRVTKVTRPDEAETTDSETESTTRRTIEHYTIKETNGKGPKRTTSPTQKPKPSKVIPKTVKTTLTTTRRDKYDVENVCNVQIVDKVNTKNDYYTTRTTKTVTNGVKIIPKPKGSKPAISESPDRKKRPNDKPRSPERSSPSKQDRIHKTTIIRKIDTYEAKPKAKTPTKRQPEQQPSTKRHVVTTTIQVTPKIKPQPKTTKPRKPTQNGRVTTEDDSDYEIVEEVKKITRTTSDQRIKTPQRVPVRGQSKPELLTSTPDRPTTKSGKKIVTTKSITINNDFNEDKEIIVNLQRSTSSREATPDRIYPRPALDEEDTGIPRYPDQICEPDEPRTRRKPTRLSDIPIIESDVETRRIDKVETSDECLLSVNQKVTKFVDEAVKLTDTNKLNITSRIPERPKSPKCKNYPDEDNEHFTSVSKKVSHFIETAEKVKHTPRDGPAPKVKRPEFTDVDETIKTDDCLLSVSDKVSKFTTVHKLQSPDYKKPVSLAKIDITPKRESPARESPRRESPRRESPLRESPRRESPKREILLPLSTRRDTTTDCVQIDSEEQTYIRRPSPTRFSPSRRGSSPDQKTPRKSSTHIIEPDSTPKSSRKDVLSPTGRLRSTESIRRAKELFENIAKEQKTSSPFPPRPSAFEPRRPHGIKTTTDEEVKLTDIGVYNLKTKTYSSEEELRHHNTRRTSYNKDELKSTRLVMDKAHRPRSPGKDSEVPGYLRPLDRSPRPHERSRSPKHESESPSRDRSPRPHDPSLDEIPHYMWPLDRTVRDYSSDREGSRSRSHSREPTPDHHLHGRLRSRGSTPDGNVPGYMKPLDRHVHEVDGAPTPDHHPHGRLRSRGSTPDGNVPGYMKPLDRHAHEVDGAPTPDHHPHGRLRSRGSTPDGNVPGYMKPLDRHAHEVDGAPTPDHHPHGRLRSRGSTPDGNVPGYMKPLDRHAHEVDGAPTPDHHPHGRLRSRGSTPDGNVPGYMKPLDRHVHEVDGAPTPDHHPHGRLRSRGSTPDGNVPGYMKPLDRHAHEVDGAPTPDHHPHGRLRSRGSTPDGNVPGYMKPLDRHAHEVDGAPTPDHHPHGRLRSRGSTPDGNVPGYMKPLDRHVHEVDETHKKVDETHRTTSKFGVTLKRTDSGRVVNTTTTTQKRKLSTVEIERIITTHEIEEIYELEILEILLERAVNYEQRRRVRSQIRIVKQLIADNKLHLVTKKTTKYSSPTRDGSKPRGKSPEKPYERKSKTEYQTEYVRKVSPTRKTDTKQFHHTDLVTKRSDVERKSEYQSSYAYNERRTSSEVKTVRSTSPETKIVRGKSPEKAPKRSVVETVTRRSPEKGVYNKTELKRTGPITKTVVEEKPSWVTQRALKKTSDARDARKTTTTTTKKSSRTSPTKECRPTDVITSSYGVGPTDENGTPLFGLRALRAQNRTDTTKVQGTVIRSHYYSENGQEPSGEVSVTKYSTDPRDLDGHVEDRNGLVSVTTTQKFGRKGTPSYKTITDKKQITDLDDECETITRKSTTTKVSRRGSVKEMSKKFIENAVEISKNERQSSYPKAGLILRTSSFKDTAKSGTGSSRESSPEKHESVSSRTSVTTVKKSTTSSSSSSKARADTFLNNKSRVRGVQDVITRMKNSEDDVQAGDSIEDQEARTLLNKFIGSQVILSGMETRTSSSSTPTTVKRTTTTTSTTSKGGGKPTVTTRTFTHPITEAEVSTVWDEQTLKLLLERSTDYEERQIIRTRIREVMAEQEVCADVVAKTKEESNGRIEGESLLLPLLQGLLDAPDNEQTADSGTESGEDLRSGLLVEVQNVLAKLAKSLTSDTNEMTPDKRTSLLQLVARLQTGLSATPAPGAPGSGDRRGSGGGQGRFGRRRRQNRHTVGVSSEELQDARRLMAEFGLCDNLEVASQPKVPLQKQNSEGSVLQFKTLGPKAPVKNAVAKPYGNSTSTSQSHSGTSSTAETPEESDAAEFNYTRPEIKPPDTNVKLTRSTSFETKPVSSNFPTEIEKKSVTQESETDEETVKGLLQTNPIYSKPKSPELDDSKSNRFNSKKLKMKRANTIDIPKPLEFYESEDDYDSDTSMLDKQNRRNNYLALRGPIRVGRNNSNTIVPAFEPKTDSDRKFMAFINKHSDDSNKSSIWAHKQTIPDRSGTNWTSRFGNIKTAFEKASTSSPSTPNTNMSSARNFWKSADDAMSAGKQSYNGPKIYKQGARNLQQMFEDKQAAQKPPWNDEKNIVTGSLKFDTKKNIKVVPQVVPVVPQAQPVNKFSHAPTSAFAAIPKKLPPPQTIQAATQTTPKPIIEPPEVIKSDYKESDSDSSTPLYLYSPKPLQTSPLGSSANTSPSTTPWGSTINENRVQKLAASKFEAPPKEVHERPRKMSREENTDKKASTVRKLSSQFDCKNNSGYSAFTTVKYGQNLNNFQPQNYTITYANQKGTNGYQPFHKYQEEKTKTEPTLSSNSFKTKKIEPQNYNTKKAEPQNYSGVYTTPKVYQANPPIPPPPQEYTSHQVIQFNQPPTKEIPKYEYSSPESSPTPQKPQYRRQTSQESIKEYEAAVTRVMKGPVSHQAVTVQQKSPKGRDEHDMEAAFNLKSVLQKFSAGEKKEERVSKKSASNRVKYELPPERKLSIDSASIAQNKQSKATATATANLQRTQSFKKAYQYDSNPAPNFLVNGKPLSMESTEINEDGESIITSKFHIPVRSSAKQEPQIKPTPPPPRTVNSQTVLPPPPTSRQVLSKSDSWHQLMHEHQKAQQKPTSPTPSKPVVRSKSSHTLAVPTVQFQAGMTKDEVAMKKRTVEAYFSGKISPSDDSLEKSDKEVKSTKTSINRKKTSEKVSIHRHGVTRSRTLPNIVCPNLLDESNVEASFEDLFKSNV